MSHLSQHICVQPPAWLPRTCSLSGLPSPGVWSPAVTTPTSSPAWMWRWTPRCSSVKTTSPSTTSPSSSPTSSRPTPGPTRRRRGTRPSSATTRRPAASPALSTQRMVTPSPWRSAATATASRSSTLTPSPRITPLWSTDLFRPWLLENLKCESSSTYSQQGDDGVISKLSEISLTAL